ncbi:MAG: succinate dehydrogenase assembly factor 2 [Tepidiphilus sp.]|jgi:antitoxin CptB|uniref:FAD assembly factor SdhE n=1 Tax=Tepidiphilus thermophilus TaxID=876478 RepID=A0A0K6IWA6_9PROT|nr:MULTISPECIES: succinate dehydrogenase assembly factor 2 [Tepidiphilus]MBI5780261.1 succinate dehydrogenase assembly factor 2 [Rhodocyclales bacterium]MBP6999333.1 succinate dehydrogenase assembly factor 2 [Tepidiphilus sp.]MDK2797829.1 antitoxin CptB [Tepidiphilus sp.]CUB07373.1 Succinate dehydrogenase flavin-adding protein, antitoxin component of the CptAB toxin-antitoxin module [Tepidiphilus thermophilus]
MTSPKGRIRWHCRRALLELDLIFQDFLAVEFERLDDEELAILEELLALEDHELWALVNGTRPIPSPRWVGMVEKLRGVRRHRRTRLMGEEGRGSLENQGENA